MNNVRQLQTATLLQNGKVLLVGGADSVGSLNTVELYDPATGMSSAAPNLSVARQYHTATLLQNCKVLVTGGQDSFFNSIAITEIYDPTSNAWSISGGTPATGDLNIARYSHTATLLPDGTVLVTGGIGITGVSSSSTEIYNPITNIWTTSTASNAKRAYHTATLLQNGTVLVAGGLDENFATLNTTEIYSGGVWTISTSLATGNLNTGRSGHIAISLNDGRIIAVGGLDSVGNVLDSIEIYNGTTWTISTSLATGSLNNARQFHTATLLPNGTILVAGGAGNPNAAAVSELYSPTSGTWSIASGSLNVARYNHSATLLPNGQVLITGGFDNGAGAVSQNVEVYDPTVGTWNSTAGNLNTARTSDAN